MRARTFLLFVLVSSAVVLWQASCQATRERTVARAPSLPWEAGLERPTWPLPLDLGGELAPMPAAAPPTDFDAASLVYSWRARGPGVYSASNRACNLRLRVSGGALQLSPRRAVLTGSAPVLLSTVAVGRGEELAELAVPSLRADGASLLLERAGLTERIVNARSGVAHGWTLFEAPAALGDGPVSLVIELSGARWRLAAQEDGEPARSATMVADAGFELPYDSLWAVDAEGRELAASLALDGERRLVVLVEDSGATYPLTIDPVIHASDASGTQVDERLGWSVATAGDVNGDGFSDSLAGTPFHDAPGLADAGLVLVLPGPDWSAAPLSLSGTEAGAQFGSSVSTAGDVDGDGHHDVLIGAPGCDGAGTDRGRAYLHLGGSSGLDPTAAWIFEGDVDSAAAGRAVAWAGDVDADGYDDVLVSIERRAAAPTGGAAVLLFRGSALGLPAQPSQVLVSPVPGSDFGAAIGAAGDVDADGYDDVIVGAPLDPSAGAAAGSAHLFRGGPGGLTLAWSAAGDAVGARFGHAVSAAGDVDGDGYADIAVGAPERGVSAPQAGAVFVYHGAAGGVSTAPPDIVEGAAQANARFGFAVATAGDVDGDGYADLVVGAPWRRVITAGLPGGEVRVYWGSAAGIDGAFDILVNAADDSQTGRAVAAGGDVDADGFSDVLIGLPFRDEWPKADSGTASWVRGEARLPDSDPDSTFRKGAPGSHLGLVLAGGRDLNGDGYDDVMVGAPWFDGGTPEAGRVFVFHGSAEGLFLDAPDAILDGDVAYGHFGAALALVGDMDGDGYDDALVGEPGSASSGAFRGMVHFYAGGASGLRDPRLRFAGPHPGSRFGHALGDAGDTDGDGLADAMIGAPLASAWGVVEAGCAYLLHGERGGPAITAGLSPAEYRQWFGYSVSGNGDWNADGLSDVAVGAPYADGFEEEPGRVFVFLGDASVTPGMPHGLKGSPVRTFVGWQPGDRLGFALSSMFLDAKTVAYPSGGVVPTGKTLTSLLAGAPEYDSQVSAGGPVHTDAGAIVVLAPNVPSIAPPVLVAAAGAQSGLGTAVAAVGDVDTDGRDDIAFGIQLSGYVNVETGGPYGVLVSGRNALLLGDPTAGYGATCAGAGDVNGDGFDDVLVGAPLFDDGSGPAGAVHLHRGNADGGRVRLLRPRRGPTPLPTLGVVKAGHAGGFEYRLDVFSAAGRDELALRTELWPLASPQRRPPTLVETGPPLRGASMVDVEVAVPNLAPSWIYSWGAALRSRHPFFPTAPLWVPGPTGRDVRKVRTP